MELKTGTIKSLPVSGWEAEKAVIGSGLVGVLAFQH